MISLYKQQLFPIHSSPVASISIDERARIIEDHLQAFAKSNAPLTSLHSLSSSQGIALASDDTILLLITPDDAQLSHLSTLQLSSKVKNTLVSAVADYRQQHSVLAWIRTLLLMLASTFALFMTLRLNRKFFDRIEQFLTQTPLPHMHGWHIQHVEILSSARILSLASTAIQLLRMIITVICWYVFLPLSLSIFPQTRRLANILLDYVLTPLQQIGTGLIRFIPNLFSIMIIITVAFYCLKVIRFFFRLIKQGELSFEWFYAEWALPTYQITRFLIIITALISGYPYIPCSNTAAFQGVGLVLGAVLSFSSSSAIANVIAGIILTYTRAFKINDRVQIGDTTGDIVEKTLLITRIRTIKNVVVTIPNSVVMNAHIINFSTSAADGDGLLIHTSITIGYGSDPQQIHQL